MRKFKIISIFIFVLAVAAVGYTHFFHGAKKDTVAPVITVPEGTLRVAVDATEEKLLADISAQDEVDGDLTDHLMVEYLDDLDENRERTMHVAVVDAAGNVARATRQITYKKYHGPRFSLKEPLIMVNSTNDTIALVKANDLIDGDISASIKLGADHHIGDAVGDYPMEFIVKNSAGDTARMTATVTNPDYSTFFTNSAFTLKKYLVYAKASKKVDPWEYLETLSLENRVYERKGDHLELAEKEQASSSVPERIDKSEIHISGKVNYKEAGTYEYLYTYSKDGNKVSVRLIVIVE